MRRSRTPWLLLGCVLGADHGQAHAQPPFAIGELGERGLVTVPMVTPLGPRQYAFSLYSGYFSDGGLSSWRVSSVALAFGLTPAVDVSVALGTDRRFAAHGTTDHALRAATKVRLARETRSWPAVGLGLEVAAYPQTAVNPRVLLEKSALRERITYGLALGRRTGGDAQGMLVGVGLAASIGGHSLLSVEVDGLAASAQDHRGRIGAYLTHRLASLTKLEAGLSRGWGPELSWRLVIGLVVSSVGEPERDRDKDGIIDRRDACSYDPEDKDGFQDDDGCPDPDNDGDGLPDISDPTPNGQVDADQASDLTPRFLHPEPRLRLAIPMRPIPVDPRAALVPPPSPKTEDLEDTVAP